ncbi:hypothetical protein [Virgibacillus alimentarius]|uniref:Histone deacetylase n=1 Tax=Virgibacillus alimentarius TaxID=698769 RepID=A0ABS4SCR6_9BACI|nr:hypothetical protein [Virgibacillus alimentarius]MBP2258694.1 hypothetical protein [Virgibacillus alimentarius]
MEVWYVSYGSNICEDRFLCYINGSTPRGADKKERGCTDKTPPRRNAMVELPYPLYFAKEQSKWGKGGVAFMGHDFMETARTIGRKYLITREQFSEVVAQENKKPGLEIDFKTIKKKGAVTITDGWYGTIFYLGDEDGFPMFTFTANFPVDAAIFTKPSAAYLATVAEGLGEIGLKKNEIIDYFLEKRGVKEHFTADSLAEYIFHKRENIF